MKRRLDVLLVEKGLAESRSRAKALVESEQVFLLKEGKEQPLTKASLEIDPDAPLLVKSGDANRFVSRAGLKLEGAFRHLGLSASGWRCLDVGQSTGGFTDFLLQSGAAEVIGVDVGHDQLAPRIREHPRVVAYEGVNARGLSREPRIQIHFKAGAADLIVMDLSFISQRVVLPELSVFAGDGTRLISLVKPQFEVGPEGLGKGGLVRDEALFEVVKKELSDSAAAAGWGVQDYFESSLPGKDGNKEFFLYGIRSND